MAKAKPVKLLSVTLPNKVGQLSAVAELLGAADVNILALRAAEAGSNAECGVVVKNPQKAKKALASLGVEIRETDALCVEVSNKAGRLLKVTHKLAAAGINLQATWSTAFTGKTASCIFLTSDDKKAISVLGKK